MFVISKVKRVERQRAPEWQAADTWPHLNLHTASGCWQIPKKKITNLTCFQQESLTNSEQVMTLIVSKHSVQERKSTETKSDIPLWQMQSGKLKSSLHKLSLTGLWLFMTWACSSRRLVLTGEISRSALMQYVSRWWWCIAAVEGSKYWLV